MKRRISTLIASLVVAATLAPHPAAAETVKRKFAKVEARVQHVGKRAAVTAGHSYCAYARGMESAAPAVTTAAPQLALPVAGQTIIANRACKAPAPLKNKQ